MIDWSNILGQLREEFREANKGNKHVSILGEQYTSYSTLHFEYDGHTVTARSKDYQFLSLLRNCIEMYLEETGE